MSEDDDFPWLNGAVVLQILPALETGGVERGTIEMVQAIRRAGGVALVASAGGRMVNLVTQAGGRHVVLPLSSKHPLRMWLNVGRLTRLIRRERVAIVHARSRAPAWSAMLAARRAGVRFVTTFHALYNENGRWKRRYNGVMAHGERVIAISRHVADHLLARYDVDPARVRVIPRGVDPALFDPERVTGPRIERLGSRWRLPMDARVVMLPGRLTPWKGHALLLEAMAHSRHQDVFVVLVGSDQGREAYSQKLIRLAERLGLSDRLRLAGDCDDMPAALTIADVVVAPSLEPEGFGRTVIEAQAMRRPVIAADHGGAVETVEQCVTGWRTPPGDVEALREAIDVALELTEEQRWQLGWQAREAVCAHYAVATMQAATLAVYAELLAGGA